MKSNYRRVPAEFGPETRFELTPVPPAPFRAVQENRFEALKNTLIEETLQTLWPAELSAHVRRAANEAAELAWLTHYPLLVYPVLFAERAALAMPTEGRGRATIESSRELHAA